LYSYSELKEVVEFINLRVRIKGKNPTLSLPAEKKDVFLLKNGWKDIREVYFDSLGWKKIPVYERGKLITGSKINGPCLIEEKISTTLTPPEFYCVIDEYRNIIIRHKDKLIP
jgi:N-methylhydantoinase A